MENGDVVMQPKSLFTYKTATIIQKTGELIAKAHKVLTLSQKKQLCLTEKERRNLKLLRRHLNQAILDLDSSSMNLLEYPVNDDCHKAVADKSHILTSALSQVKEFIKKHESIELNEGKDLVGTINENVRDTQCYQSFSEQMSCKFATNIASRLSWLAKSNNLLAFEREINSLTEFHEAISDCIRKFVRHQRDAVDLDKNLDRSLSSTRLYLSEARKLSLRHVSNKSMESIHILSKQWINSQISFFQSLWHSMTPWASIVAKLFEEKKDFKNQMAYFNFINRRLQSIIMSLEYHQIQCDSLNENSKIKISFLRTDLEKYCLEIFDFVKLNVMDELQISEWPKLNLLLFKWVYIIHELFKVVDGDNLLYVTRETFMNSHTEWVSIIGRMISCDQSMSVGATHQFSVLSKELNVTFEDAKAVLTSGTVKQIDCILIFAEWKTKISALCHQINEVASNISKPLALLYSSTSCSSQEVEDFLKKIKRVRTHACLAIRCSADQRLIHELMECMDKLDIVSIEFTHFYNDGAIHSSACNILKYNWLSLVYRLLFILRKVKDVKYTAISAIMRHLFTDKDVSTPYEFLDVLSEQSDDYISSGVASSYCSDKYACTAMSTDTFCHGSRSSSSCTETHLTSEINTDSLSDHFQVDNKKDTGRSSRRRLQSDSFDRSAFLNTDLTDSKSVFYNSFENNVENLSQKRLIQNFTIPVEIQKTERSDDIASKLKKTQCGVVSPNLDGSTKTISAIAQVLMKEAGQWEDANNSIVRVVKLMAHQMFEMSQFAEGHGELKTEEEFMATAKAISSSASFIAKFATILSECTFDDSCRSDLLHYAELVPTISTQLRIVASVKSVNVHDDTAYATLISNTANLMKAVIDTLKAAEAASMKMPKNVEMDHEMVPAAIRLSHELVLQWKRKTRLNRAMTALACPRDELGLRISAKPSQTLDNLLLTST